MNWSKEFTIRKPKNKQRFQITGLLIFPRDRFKEKEFQEKLLCVFSDKKDFAITENKKQNLLSGGYFVSGFSPPSPDFPYNILMYVGGEDHHRDEGPLSLLSRAGYQGIHFHLNDDCFYAWSYEHMQWLIAWFREAMLNTGAVFGCLDNSDELLQAGARNPFEHIYGLTCYNKETAERIGIEKLLNAPIYKVEKLRNNYILLQLSENPVATVRKPTKQKLMYKLGLGPAPEDKGTSAGKAPDLPGWLTGASLPDTVEVPEDCTVQVIAGLRANELHVTGLDADQTLFEYFMEDVLEQMDCEKRPEFAFCSWFNGTGTGLEAFAGGCKVGDEELDVFVGSLVGTLSGQHFSSEFEFKRIREAMTRTREKFRELGFKEEPKLTFILLWWFG